MVGVSEANGEVFLLPKITIGAVVFSYCYKITAEDRLYFSRGWSGVWWRESESFL
ncbi:hypothetical protein HYV50_04855 [Candidatus Pacearchaeota archaeon]|nr:hypothetical protein [Candidatus Pacearchaeota archaeon]